VEIHEEILAQKKDLKAVILAHNYQLGEVQDIADFVGDSLDLSRKAAETNAEVIVFCGVHFMAETAAILSPNKTVIMPDPGAGCPMADMITDAELREEKKKFPDATVVTYVNSTAAVKAESDWCCTSSNAVGVIEAVESDKILFVPDKYLGAYVASKAPEKEFIFWNGFCPTHAR
jgi:quinolinate synthase